MGYVGCGVMLCGAVRASARWTGLLHLLKRDDRAYHLNRLRLGARSAPLAAVLPIVRSCCSWLTRWVERQSM